MSRTRSRAWWRRLHNRGAKPAIDAGMLLSSSALPLRLRGWGKAQRLVPCLAEDERGGVLAYGEQAQVMEGRAPHGVLLSRPIHEGRIRDLDGGKFLLEKLLRASNHGVLMGPRLLVGVASHLTPLERKTVEEVAKAAGARKVALVDVCLLALLGSDRDPFASAQLVVDLGAGHGEVALLARGSILQVRTIPAAGNRMDLAVQEMVLQRYGVRISERQAERLKCEVGAARQGAERGQKATVAGCDAATGLPSSVEVEAGDVREALIPVLTELAKEVRQVLKDAPPQLVSDISENRAVLVGGGANLPGLVDFLEAETQLDVFVPEGPELAAQRGLDLALAEPKVRRRLLAGDRALLAPAEGGGRLTEKLVGLAAVAMLLFASYFPSDDPAKVRPLVSMVNGLSPVWSGLRSSFAPVAQEQTAKAEAAEKDRKLRRLAEENRKLRQVAKAPPPQWVDGEALPARVVGRASQSWNERLVVDAGRAQGVVSGMAAVSDRGLVGRVQSVTDSNAQVRLLSSEDSEMGGRVQRTRSAGVIKPAEDGGLEIHFLDPDDGVKKGDLVVTSGLDGFYPPGIPVGKVEQLFRPANEVYMAARLRPLPDLDKLEGVLLVGGPQL